MWSTFGSLRFLRDPQGSVLGLAAPAQVYERMLRDGVSPTGTTYTSLISAYGKAGQVRRLSVALPYVVGLPRVNALPH